jgi:hypothetical protein
MITIDRLLRPLGLTAAAIAAGSFLIQSAPAQAVEIVKNGDFSIQGATILDAADWTRGGVATIQSSVGPYGRFAFVGNLQDPRITLNGSWTQNISTVIGSSYALRYDFATYGNSPDGTFQVKFGDTILSTLTSTTSSPSLNPYSTTFIGSGNGSLSFNFTKMAASAIDNVVVELIPPVATSVPEPLTIVGTVIGGMTAIRMRKKLSLDKNID